MFHVRYYFTRKNFDALNSKISSSSSIKYPASGIQRPAST
jgi:hypothetical protein